MILTDVQIDQQCIAYSSAFGGGEYAYLFNAMYLGIVWGFRVNEVVEIERWSHIGNNYFKVDTEKGSSDRTILLDWMPELMIESIETQKNLYVPTSQTTINKVLRGIGPFAEIRVKDKHVGYHLFRYNQAKRIYAQTESYQAVADYLGVTYAVAKGYADAVVTGVVR